MEITIEIDDKKVKFKSNGVAVPKYMAQFQRDLIKDILALGVAEVDFEKATQAEKIDWMRKNVDFTMFYNIAWLFAKIADPKIPEPMDWLAGFDVFPIFEIIEPLQDLLALTIGAKKKPQIHSVTAKKK